ncbi:CsbD family protein [Histidinibacterium aquaticum]|uniref:Uncharacterized protein n=1 Tax=Histidinibacterium aquaticum TaxID=2613962 RepID=A0A5J5GLI6_9RHOB|nr:hypothetical protein [Histidinibacterium aquaticum]KAA9009159.1 hypothetical protein F3S47_07850 [Histidinibacterium aquaticum]
MNWSDVETNWEAHVPQILTRWPELEEDDVLATEGDRTEFGALLSRQLGLSPSVADSEIADWLMGLEPADAVMDPSRDSERIRDAAAHIPEGEDVYAEDGDFGDEGVSDRPIGRDT